MSGASFDWPASTATDAVTTRIPINLVCMAPRIAGFGPWYLVPAEATEPQLITAARSVAASRAGPYVRSKTVVCALAQLVVRRRMLGCLDQDGFAKRHRGHVATPRLSNRRPSTKDRSIAPAPQAAQVGASVLQ